MGDLERAGHAPVGNLALGALGALEVPLATASGSSSGGIGRTRRPEKFPAWRKIGVSTAAGSMVATSMPGESASSWRRHSLNARIANLLVT
jgi:hypothetical protein